MVIVALTADAYSETREQAAQAGMDEFLTKPVQPTELQATPDNYNQSAYYDDITLSLLPAPQIASTSFSNKTNLVVNATGGVLGWSYNVLMTTDAGQPLSQWTPISTNLLTANGPFTLIATNGVSASSAKRFFAVRCGIQP